MFRRNENLIRRAIDFGQEIGQDGTTTLAPLTTVTWNKKYFWNGPGEYGTVVFASEEPAPLTVENWEGENYGGRWIDQGMGKKYRQTVKVTIETTWEEITD